MLVALEHLDGELRHLRGRHAGITHLHGMCEQHRGARVARIAEAAQGDLRATRFERSRILNRAAALLQRVKAISVWAKASAMLSPCRSSSSSTWGGMRPCVCALFGPGFPRLPPTRNP